MPVSRRAIALGVVTLLLGALLAVVPQPVIAIEQGTRLDTIVPDLEPASAPAPGADADELATQSEARLFASEKVSDFELIGATFASDQIDDGRIRVLVDGRWSPWEELTNVDGGHGPEPGSDEAAAAKPASDPIWVGDGEGFELDLPGDATEVAVHLVRETEERVVVDATPQADAYRMPSVRSRRAWGARAPSHRPGTANTVKRAVIHHTVNTNNYSSGAVPGMIRSIQRYHMGAQGWWDIGYNFIVDRFGRRWEGRSRSTYAATIGAHAKGSNTGSTGVAYLGTGTSVPMTAIARESVSKLIAWKLPLHGTFFGRGAIVGHRDVFPTSCPGNAIHRQLGSVRTRAVRLRPPRGPYLDVPNSSRNASLVRWARDKRLARGYRDGNFRPNGKLTRAMFVRMLWGLAGHPRVATPHGYVDVQAGSQLNTAVKWARASGITGGASRFRPDGRVNRATFIVQIHRWAGTPNAPVPAGFSDVGPGSWSEEAVDWAKWFGAMSGTGDNQFEPRRVVLRAQALRVLLRVRPYTDIRGELFEDGARWARFHRIVGFGRGRFSGSAPINRGQGVRMLWMMMNRPAGAPDHSWPDVSSTAWFDAALDWATEAGVVDGLAGGTDFGPAAILTRADQALWVWRASGSPAASQPHGLADVPAAAPYDAALDWAIEHGVLFGYDDGTFRPEEALSRADWVLGLHRLASTATAWVGGAAPPFTARF